MEAFCQGKKNFGEPLACKQTSALASFANHICVCKANTNIVRTLRSGQIKNRPHRSVFYLAGMDGFEPSKCQSQSLVPYRLATSQYCFSILSYFILVVKHFIKKFVFYKKMRMHQLKYDTKTCFLFSNNL